MSTYEYEDEEKARAWFDATTPDREAFRAFDAIRHEVARRVGDMAGEERQALVDELNAATDRMEQAAQHVSELLANFDLELIGLGAGVACLHATWLPPAEEVLCLMLTLQYREPWIRNLSGNLTGTGPHYPNPFMAPGHAQFHDGVDSASAVSSMYGAMATYNALAGQALHLGVLS